MSEVDLFISVEKIMVLNTNLQVSMQLILAIADYFCVLFWFFFCH